MPSVAVVTPNWNGGKLALVSARSLTAQSLEPRLFLIDNGSHDGSSQEIVKSCPNVVLTSNPTNLGYAAATNQGLRLALDSHDYVVFANNDVVLAEPRSLEIPLAKLETDERCDGVCGRYLSPDGSFQRFYARNPTPSALILYFGIGRHLPFALESRTVARYLCSDVDFARPQLLEQPGFSCVVLRSSAVKSTGLLDEGFPIFFNDVDYCWRWQQTGRVFNYLPDWTITHHKSASTQRLGTALETELAASLVRFAVKHFSRREAMAVRASVVARLLWRRHRHGDVSGRLRDVWNGSPFFVADQPPAERV